MPRPLSDRQYAQLLQFRTSLRQFLKWSESTARAAGMTPAQHQLLLAIKGHTGGPPSISEIAGYLMLRHHSVVELVDRASQAGLVERQPDLDDGRVIRVALTDEGEARLESIAPDSVREIKRLAPMLQALADTPEGIPPA